MQATSPLRRIALAAALIAGSAIPSTYALAQGGWFASQERGNGAIKSQTRAVAHYSGLEFGLPGKAELRIDNTEGVTIETDENLLPFIETKVEDGVLMVRTARRVGIEPHQLRVVVHAKAIDKLSLGGSGSVESDALRAPALSLAVGGSGSIDVKEVQTQQLSVSIGGSGDLKVDGGSADRVTVSIGGSGDADAGMVKARDVRVNIAGSGKAVVWAGSTLSLSVAGSGDVDYYGDPKISKTVIGSGGLNRLGAAPHGR